MLFHTFHSQEERRKFGGSYFTELQYCEAAPGSKPEELLKRYLIYFEKLMNTNLPEQEKLMQWLEKRNLLPAFISWGYSCSGSISLFCRFRLQALE